ncbi:MAG: DUF2779 domain-containing protein [Nitrospirae bacterium]|nr:DUF2779 domain-containing protein [Nitrospirota bacterium]
MLSKSDLQSWLQCPRKLWLEHKKPELIPDDDGGMPDRRITDGNIVGEKAREQLGRNYLWPPRADNPAAAAEQAKKMLAEEPDKPAVEVPMLYQGLYTRADALLPEKRRYILRETKASTLKLKSDEVTPRAPEEHHLNDVAIQVWTMAGWGLPMARAELNLLDSQWRYPGDGDYSGLFRQLDVTGDAKALKKDVPRWLREAKAVLVGRMPKVVTGKQCADPYECPFLEYCEERDPPGPEHPIELLPDSAGKALARKLRDTKGYTSILDPKPNELIGTQADLYRRIQKAHRTGKAILEPGSGAELKKLPYPRYYFDFESIDCPIPRWKGVRPYEHIPFQWSCHIERAPGRFEHEEFLDLTGNDPSRSCLERMREVIDPNDDGPIIVYYRAFEKNRLEEFGERHPDYNKLLQQYISRLVDLHPIVKQHCYHPQMEGSFSIKKVLSAIAPDLDYEELDEIQEGTGAQAAYLYATMDPKTTAVRKADLESKLRQYCRRDTWAMV